MSPEWAEPTGWEPAPKRDWDRWWKILWIGVPWGLVLWSKIAKEPDWLLLCLFVGVPLAIATWVTRKDRTL